MINGILVIAASLTDTGVYLTENGMKPEKAFNHEEHEVHEEASTS